MNLMENRRRLEMKQNRWRLVMKKNRWGVMKKIWIITLIALMSGDLVCVNCMS